MKKSLHFLFAILILTGAMASPATAQDARWPRSLEDWKNLTAQDGRLDTLVRLIGKPDYITINGYYAWRRMVDNGAKDKGVLLAKVQKSSVSDAGEDSIIEVGTYLPDMTPTITQESLQPKGIVLHKEQESYKSDAADAEEYSAIQGDGSGGVIIPEGTFNPEDTSSSFSVSKHYPSSVYAGYVPYPNLESFHDIRTSADLEPIKREIQRLTNSWLRFPNAGKFLKPYIGELQEDVTQFNSGKIKYDGEWIAKGDLASHVEADRLADEQMTKVKNLVAEQEKQRELVARRAFDERGRAEQEEFKAAEQQRLAEQKQMKEREVEEQRLAETQSKAEEQKIAQAAPSPARAIPTPPPTQDEIMDASEKAGKVAGADAGARYAMIEHRIPSEDELDAVAKHAYFEANARNPIIKRKYFLRTFKETFQKSWNYAYDHYVGPAF